MPFDVIVLGAGAAGLMCAATAGQRGRSVLVIEQARRPAEKVRISGGGRSNFTNLHTTPANFLSQNPRFCRSALSRYTQHDFIALVRKYRIAFHEKTRGQLFCDHSSQEIIDLLLAECERGRVDIRLNNKIGEVTRNDAGFTVRTDAGVYTGKSLVVATGGPSIPKMGASAIGYKLAQQFGLAVVPPRAGLVPLTFDPQMLGQIKDLAGVAVDAVTRVGKTQFDEALLFTHRGLSGPAILQISSYWRDGDDVIINLAPGVDALAHLKEARRLHPRQELATVLAEFLPRRLAQVIAQTVDAPQRLADASDRVLAVAADAVNAWRVRPNGTEGYRTAEVTLGGVDTAELSSKTFESSKVPGLHFIGEVIDVTGHLGGFNFQWAWSSGFAAGSAI